MTVGGDGGTRSGGRVEHEADEGGENGAGANTCMGLGGGESDDNMESEGVEMQVCERDTMMSEAGQEDQTAHMDVEEGVRVQWMTPGTSQDIPVRAARLQLCQQVLSSDELKHEKEELAKMQLVLNSIEKISNAILQSRERDCAWTETAVTTTEDGGSSWKKDWRPLGGSW